MEADVKLKRHLIDLSNQAERYCAYTFSNFLGINEQDIFYKSQGEFARVRASLYGINEGTERKIAVFGSPEDFGYEPEYPVRVLEVKPAAPKFAEDLSHRDYLGSVMGLGVEREMIGDIVIRDKTAWICCMEGVADYLKDSLSEVRRTTVQCRLAAGDIPALAPRFEAVSLNVASGRLDCILAAFINQSRSRALALLSGQQVTLNGRITQDPSKVLKEGDIFSVRGFGKAVYDGIGHETKKGRLYVSLRKYI